MLDLLKAIVDLNGFAEARVQSVLDPLCAGLLEVKKNLVDTLLTSTQDIMYQTYSFALLITT